MAHAALLALALAASPADLARKVQDSYESTRDLEAQFT
jgi:hypothetical protein